MSSRFTPALACPAASRHVEASALHLYQCQTTTSFVNVHASVSNRQHILNRSGVFGATTMSIISTDAHRNLFHRSFFLGFFFRFLRSRAATRCTQVANFATVLARKHLVETAVFHVALPVAAQARLSSLGASLSLAVAIAVAHVLLCPAVMFAMRTVAPAHRRQVTPFPHCPASLVRVPAVPSPMCLASASQTLPPRHCADIRWRWRLLAVDLCHYFPTSVHTSCHVCVSQSQVVLQIWLATASPSTDR